MAVTLRLEVENSVLGLKSIMFLEDQLSSGFNLTGALE